MAVEVVEAGVAFECSFRCGFLAVVGDGAMVHLADGAFELVCEFCRANLENGRPARSAGYVTSVDGAVHRVFMMSNPEGSA